MAEITITLKDGDTKKFSSGTRAGEALKELVSNKVRKQTVALRSNGTLVDLSAALEADAVVEPVTVSSDDGLEILRHSAAHVMALAVKQLGCG